LLLSNGIVKAFCNTTREPVGYWRSDGKSVFQKRCYINVMSYYKRVCMKLEMRQWLTGLETRKDISWRQEWSEEVAEATPEYDQCTSSGRSCLDENEEEHTCSSISNKISKIKFIVVLIVKPMLIFFNFH